MPSHLLLMSCLVLILGAALQESFAATAEAPAVIPAPQQLERKEGDFSLTARTGIKAPRELQAEALYLQERLNTATGFGLQLVPVSRAGAGLITLALSGSGKPGEEGYTLSVSPKGVVITGATAAGVFYGIQTLLQLLPPQIYGDTPAAGVTWSAPAVEISDSPRFAWRSYLLDTARWYHSVNTIKRMIDQLAMHKMNRLLWYLTDDQGWRVQIRQYPRLTEIGSRRQDTQVGGWNSEQRAGEPHGGFYSQQEIREVVAYAAVRHVTIVPVISMPGHASAAIAAYPELGASGDTVEVEQTFGVKLNVFNVADEKVYTFLENVLTEVMALFPSKVIHLGGDEVKFNQWMESPQVKALMEREGLAGPAEVQLYFTNRMSRFLESKGRRMMGWNEILGQDLHGFLKNVGGEELQAEQGANQLASNAIVHFWKGSLELAQQAVLGGHDIVNSLHSETYLDYSYEDIPLAKAYAFEPIPEGLAAEHHAKVIGLGCQMWGEWTPTRERLEFQTFPRLSAYAEVGWSAKESRQLEDYLRRMTVHRQRWDVQGIGYAEGK